MSEITEVLVNEGKKLFKEPSNLEFTSNSEANQLLKNLENYPHFFTLACIMDRKIKTERAWLIPYEIFTEVGTYEFFNVTKMSLEDITEIFNRKNLHWFNNKMAKYFYLAVRKISDDYDGNASKIWNDYPRSATVVRRFLEFEGVGIKIASMAANTLVRDFKVPMADYFFIDVSPDAHVRRVFKRIGLIDENATNDEIIYRAKEINPEYPGILDLPCWEVGTNWCKPKNPKCSECFLDKYCPKIIVS
ncbi:MAG: iron-sulfur cluster loop [Alphaproteobacteria bacterium]|nr:MAG: iron-sulfur cluster loop [Alphaproteobacteria bacterium]